MTFILTIVALIILWKHGRAIRRLEKAIKGNEPSPLASEIKFFTIINGQKKEVTEMFLKISDQLPMSITISDKFGNAAKVDGAPAWALTDPSLGSLEVAEDGMSAMLKPAGIVGVMKVQVSCDADLGEGVKSIMGELDVELLPGEAVSVSIAAGSPEPLP